jgi:TPR repeat protein
MLTLGYLYLTGYGVGRNTETAAYWYSQAAQNGETVPQEWQDARFLARTEPPPPYNEKLEGQARVKRAQAGLKVLGYYRSRVDGIDGPGTSAAVKRFQEDQQIEVNGRIDVTLMRTLHRTIVYDPMKRHM